MPSGIRLEILSDCIKAKVKMPSSTREMRRRLDIVSEKAQRAGINRIEVEIDMGPSHENRFYRFNIGSEATPQSGLKAP